jgi:hypothetical protein
MGPRACGRPSIEVFGADVPVQHCQWHKRENALSYLTKPPQVVRRRKLPVAYTHPRYADAKRARQNLGQDFASTQRVGGAARRKG